MPLSALQISEIFTSIQGESTDSGQVTTFVRLTGCPVRCVYCDTEWAFSGGVRRELDDVLRDVQSRGCRRVCVTGGEPLAQQASHDLIARLIDDGYLVSVETSGVRSIAGVPRPSKVVLDLKTPSSGAYQAWLAENLDELQAGDELKAVCCNRADWEWLCETWRREHERLSGVTWLVSAAEPMLQAAELADWLIDSGLPFRLNLQLHKVLWPGVDRGR
ncbi:MAG: radical SAM protein [Candidatus Dadabacteria bacterium]|nr:MAG: radical SAM protein [Candidatus Dadabacteria bacterium]